MQAIEKNLFAQISAEESANVNGGGIVTTGAYLTVTNALFPDLTGDPVQLNTAFLFLINAQAGPGTFVTP
ncbi:hypothetical protein [Nostoc sp. CENA543]|uniref:hypothetical protein n=1 Tax=Nostoc sp. CENA543 TaxID=1869241 RepID=UPI0012FFEAE9|nr:hypothetical protein [Nostoc sp. CENA543]